MSRAILSVVAGFLFWSVLWLGGNAALARLLPDAFDAEGVTGDVTVLAGLIVLAAVISVLSGMATVRVGPRNPGKAVAALAAVLLVVGIFVEIQYWNVMPVWYHLIFLAVLVPATVWGGRLAERALTPGTGS